MIGKLVIALGCLLAATALVESRAPTTRSMAKKEACVQQVGKAFLNRVKSVRVETCEEFGDLALQAVAVLGPDCAGTNADDAIAYASANDDKVAEMVEQCAAEYEQENDAEEAQEVVQTPDVAQNVESVVAEQAEVAQNDQTGEESVEATESDATSADQSVASDV